MAGRQTAVAAALRYFRPRRPELQMSPLPGFKLYAPNFSGVEFSRVKFPVEESYCLWDDRACFFKNNYCFWNDTFCLTRHRNDATLPAATFNSTSFSFDENGKSGDNDFSGAGPPVGAIQERQNRVHLVRRRGSLSGGVRQGQVVRRGFFRSEFCAWHRSGA